MTILFIDDDSEDLDMYQEVVRYINASDYFADRDKKIDCHTASTCKNIIERISALPDKPDIIFLDINMPGIGGKECLIVLKTQPEYSAIPIVMLSTTCPTQEITDFKNCGALDCIQKPNNFNSLVKIFSKYIFQHL